MAYWSRHRRIERLKIRHARWREKALAMQQHSLALRAEAEGQESEWTRAQMIRIWNRNQMNADRASSRAHSLARKLEKLQD